MTHIYLTQYNILNLKPSVNKKSSYHCVYARRADETSRKTCITRYLRVKM